MSFWGGSLLSGRSCMSRGLWCCGSCSGLIVLIAATIALIVFFFKPVEPKLVSNEIDQFLAGPKAPKSLANHDGTKPIRLELNFEQAMVDISTGPAGAALHLESRFDQANFELVTEAEAFEKHVLYRVSLRRRGPAFVGLFDEAFDPSQNQLYMRLPADLVYDVRLQTDRGLYDIDLGGMTLAGLDIQAKRSDLGLSCSKFNPQPLALMNFECWAGSYRINDMQNYHFTSARIDGMLGDLTLSNSGDFTTPEINLELSMTMGSAKLELPRSAKVYDEGPTAEGYGETPSSTSEEYQTQIHLKGGVSFGEHTITYRTRLPRADQLMRRLFHESADPAEVIARIRQIYQENPDSYDFNETSINQFGYQMLQRKNVEAAIEIFKFNIEIHSDYANGYDSLAEAYHNQGALDQAIQNYEKSLELNPYNSNGKKMLRRIQLEMEEARGLNQPDEPEQPEPPANTGDAT